MNEGDVLERVRARAARVMDQAGQVRVAGSGLRRLATELARSWEREPETDPARLELGEPDTTLAYVLTLDAVNFGSGWFPLLRKRPGLSGYFTLATALRERFEVRGPFTAEELRALRPTDCARLLGQDPADAELGELMALFARALAELGAFLAEGYGGRFAGPVEAAGGSAAQLVGILSAMPLYRDVERYAGFEVPFYKRAQITAADLGAAFGGEGPGRFHDLDRLTCFADNLVPHVLRREGALVYAPELAKRIDAEELIAAGSPEEVELRAGAVHAVELLVAELAAVGLRVSAQQLDQKLWTRGQRPEMKAHPRHRTRTCFY